MAILLMLAGATSVAQGQFWGYDGAREGNAGWVLEAGMDGFGGDAYREAVARVLRGFEERTGRRLVPGEKRRVALKVNTNQGLGLATPTRLVSAVVEGLVARGFDREELFIVDVRERLLREAHFLAPLSARKPDVFQGVPVRPLDGGGLYDPGWFYESALPDPGRLLRESGAEDIPAEEDRKSLLAAPLLTGVDFWINLPVYSDHPVVGLEGALVNASLRNASNTERFFGSESAGSVAVAEIAAIPELLSNCALTIVTLEVYQFIGGPGFNSLYTRSEPKLLGSVNAVALDAIMLGKINKARREGEFPPLEEPLALIEFSSHLGLGPEVAEVVRLDAGR